MHPALRLLDQTVAWLLAGVAVAVGSAMVYSNVVDPLLSGHGVQPDQAVFAIGALLAEGTLAYYFKYRTKAAQWATFFMVALCIWAHALVFVGQQLFRGAPLAAGDCLRLAVGALGQDIFGVFGTDRATHVQLRQVKPLCASHLRVDRFTIVDHGFDPRTTRHRRPNGIAQALRVSRCDSQQGCHRHAARNSQPPTKHFLPPQRPGLVIDPTPEPRRTH